ncbi:MAG: alpha/beta hydrolase [Candidatus Omnitrophota bacterium]|nr:alpha/beta hydrolase [Candidatus Omnitrophota bacterium]
MRKSWIGVILVGLLWHGCATAPKTFLAADGVPIAYKHQVVEGARGTAILLHGLGSSYDEWYDFAKFLNREGWSTLAIDFRGHGESTEWLGANIDWHNFPVKSSKLFLRDVEAAARHLEGEGELWLVGGSMGSGMSLSYAAEHAEISGIVLLSPGLKTMGLDLKPAIERYGTRPILVAASADDGKSVANSQYLHEKAAGPKKIITYEDAGHSTAMLDWEKDLKQEILSFMNEHVKPKAGG